MGRLVLITDLDGQVQSSNREPPEGMGHCSQRIGMVDSSGKPVCSPGCSPGDKVTQEAVGYSGRLPARLICTPLRGCCVISLEELSLPPEPVHRPSPRELEILLLIAEGYPDPEIAQLLGISTGTVRVHVQNIRKKMGARSRAEALARALTLGLI